MLLGLVVVIESWCVAHNATIRRHEDVVDQLAIEQGFPVTQVRSQGAQLIAKLNVGQGSQGRDR